MLTSIHRLVILDEQAGKLATDLQQLFSGVFEEVVIAGAFGEGDPFVIDLNLLHKENENGAIQANFRAFERARKYANFEHSTGMYIYVGHTNFDLAEPALKAGFLGLGKTAAIEWPDIFVKAVGIDHPDPSDDRLARCLFGEVMKGGMDSEVFYDQAFKRYQLTLQEEEAGLAMTETNELQDEAVVLVTGGGRGITAECIIELARQKKLRFAILGRTELFEEQASTRQCATTKALMAALIDNLKAQGQPIDLPQVGRESDRIMANRDIHKTLEIIASLGSEVTYHTTDVTHPEQTKKMVDEIVATYGEISAIIHGAGVLSDKSIIDKTDSQFERVFNTKVLGFENLLQATEDQPLTHICCFSSVSGRFGNLGQSDYAMANEVLNKRCLQEQKRRKGQCSIKSIIWGPWEGGMVSDQLKERFEAIGKKLIPIDEGTKAFVSVLHSCSGAVEVSIDHGYNNWLIHITKPGTFSVWVHETTFPIFKDHAIKGLKVVPMVTAINQSLYIGSYLFGSADVSAIGVSVMKGIKVPTFDQEGLWLTYESAALENGDYEVRIFCEDSRLPSYRIHVRNERPSPLSLPDIEPGDLRSFEKAQMIAQPGYFHGPDLQALRSTENFTDKGADFLVDDLTPDDLDLKLMDGALQATSVQAGFTAEAQVAPLSCEAFRWYRRPDEGARLLYKLRLVESQQFEFTSNIQLTDLDSGEVYFEFIHVKVFAYEMGLV